MTAADPGGNPRGRGHVSLPGPAITSSVGITYAPSWSTPGILNGSVIYVTNGDTVTAYSPTLDGPISPPGQWFSGLQGAGGITFDFNTAQFWVTSSAGICPFEFCTGGIAPAGGCSSIPNESPQGLAYDPDQNIVWESYCGGGGCNTVYYEGPGALVTPPPPFNSIQPIGGPMAVCPMGATATAVPDSVCADAAIATGTPGATMILFGGTAGVTAYQTDGTPVGSDTLGTAYAISCDAQGNVYVAANKGLYIDKAYAPNTPGSPCPNGNACLDGTDMPVTNGFAGLTPPLYGVFAIGENVGYSGAGSCLDAGAGSSTPATPIPGPASCALAYCPTAASTTNVQGQGENVEWNNANWCLNPAPSGAGYYCCQWGFGGGPCPSCFGGNSTSFQCIDYYGHIVVDYFNLDPEPPQPPLNQYMCPLGVGPTGTGAVYMNCSSAQLGYLVPSPGPTAYCNGTNSQFQYCTCGICPCVECSSEPGCR